MIYDGHLTEIKLRQVLEVIFKGSKICSQFSFKDNRRMKYDYAVESEKLLIEFDGYGHFVRPMLSDRIKQDMADKYGYNLIRVPYFIQMTDNMVAGLFGKIMNKSWCNYPSGFIDVKATLPSEYCDRGLASFGAWIEKLAILDISTLFEVYRSIISKCIDLDTRIIDNRMDYIIPEKSVEHIETLLSVTGAFMSKQNFIKASRMMHGDTYDYSEVQDWVWIPRSDMDESYQIVTHRYLLKHQISDGLDGPAITVKRV